jgi:hypothetical protein
MDVHLTVAAPELQKSTQRRDIVTYCERCSFENDGPSRVTPSCGKKYFVTLAVLGNFQSR